MHTLRKMQLFDYLNYLFLIGFSCVMLYPLLYVFSISVSDGEAVWRQSVKLFPIGFNLDAYEASAIAKANAVVRAYRNSIVYTVLGTTFTLIVCLLAAYPLSEPRFRWRGPISLILGMTLFFSAGLIPTYLAYQSYGLLNTIWVITLPVAFNFWFIILVRANISMIPRELKDAARVDGASDFRILLQIIVPLSKPILATIALFVAVAIWNDFFNPLLYLNEQLGKVPLDHHAAADADTGSHRGGGAGELCRHLASEVVFQAGKDGNRHRDVGSDSAGISLCPKVLCAGHTGRRNQGVNAGAL